MITVTLLGTGGPRPDPDRSGPATLVQVDNEFLLFDAGRGVVNQMKRAGVPLGQLRHVFLTHHHFDHIGDIYDVILSSWFEGRRETLTIYGPPETARIVNALLTQVYDKDIEFRDQGEPAQGGFPPVKTIDVIQGPVAATPQWSISAEYVVHGHGLPLSPAFRKRWVCLGYRLEAQGRAIAISGDTVACNGLTRLARDADVLVQCCYLASAEIENDHLRTVCELTLACGDTVGRIATESGVKTLMLTHHRRKGADMVEALRAEVSRSFSGRLVVGRDLDAVTLD